MAKDASGRPNILWICADMLRYDAVGALGNGYVKTPTMDGLVEGGVAFTQAYCQNVLCAPSRASFLTGRYTSATGVVANGQEAFPGRETLVTKTLSDAGYDCGLAGKLHIAAVFERITDPETGAQKASPRVEPRVEDGYRVFDWSHDPMNDWGEADAYHRWIDTQGVDLWALRKAGKIPERLNQTTWCADRGIEFITREGKAPWLFSLNFFHPHGAWDLEIERVKAFDIDSLPGPLFRESDLTMQNEYLREADFSRSPAATRPEAFEDGYLESEQGGLSGLGGAKGKSLQAGYWATVELVDRQMGRVIEVLKESGQYENTVIILHADHGLPVGDHGLLGAGCRFYDCYTRVPLVLAWPGRFERGVRAEGLVELVDLAPTLLEIAGLPRGEGMHGKSLVPELTGRADAGHIKEGVRGEYYGSFNRLDGTQAGTYATMWREERWKLVVYHGMEIGELYDMEQDPGEFENLWDSPAHAQIKCRLMKACFDRCMLTIDRGPRQIGHA